MPKIGLLSDTHGYLDETVFEYFKNCDEIWHAGDIGSEEVTEKLKNFKPVRAVYGNIDGGKLREEFPQDQFIEMEGVKIFITHIAGSFGVYNTRVKNIIQMLKPTMLICGHSHILKVAFDKRFKLLYMNPGAVGKHGFHKVRTMLRFDLKNGKPQNLEVIELGVRA